MIGRRSFITGLISLFAAPAIVRVGSLMPVKGVEFEFCEAHLVTIPYIDSMFRMLSEHPRMTATQAIESVMQFRVVPAADALFQPRYRDLR